MEKQRIELSEKQQQRVAAFRAPLEGVVAQIQSLQKQESALRMGVETLLATVLECRGADDQARYQLSDDGTYLSFVGEATNGVAK